MSRISDKIRAYVNDPYVADHYGEWGILRPDQRRLIRELCDTCDAFERRLDSECERLRHILDCYAVEYGSVRDHHLVEVVRCKDCKFSECCVVNIRAYNEELGLEHIPDPNDFYCAFGTREEN